MTTSPFGYAQGRPFGCAQGGPFDCALRPPLRAWAYGLGHIELECSVWLELHP